MHGNIQIEVLNDKYVMVKCTLRDVTDYGKHLLVMSLAQSLEMSPTDILITPLLYPDFIEEAKRAKTNLSNNRSNPEQ